MNKYNKRLLFVVNVDWFFVSHRLPIAVEAMKHGYEVHLACTFTDKRTYLEELGLICHEVTFSRSGNSIVTELSAIWFVRRLLRTIKVDVVHAVTIKPVIYTGFALQTLISPPAFVAAISGLGYVFTANSFRAKLTKRFVTLMYKASLRHKRKIVIFQNTSDQAVLSSIVNLSERERTLIKGSGADLSVYNYRPEPASSGMVVSMACRLLKEKGVYQFVEAARIVRRENPGVQFWLIGSVDRDNPNTVSQSEIDSWVEEGAIKALGQRKDIPELFAKSNLVTMPSFYGEGVPKVLIEAAACGRAIVTTDNPGCRDSIIENETGLLVPIKNSKSLAEALLSLLKDSERRIQMGKKARQFAINEFDVVNVVDRHLEIYRTLVVTQ